MWRPALLLLLMVAGCGYQFGAGSLPGEVRHLYLAQATNHTLEPLLENYLGRPLTAALARQPQVSISNTPEAAEAILNADITAYRLQPLSYDSSDRISEYQATMVVRFSLRRTSDEQLLWQGELQRQESYNAASDKNYQEDLEVVAQQALAEDIASDLLHRLITRF